MHIHIIKGMAILSGLAVGGRYRVYQSKKIASSQAQKIIIKKRTEEEDLHHPPFAVFVWLWLVAGADLL